MRVFDANIGLGRFAAAAGPSFETADALLANMDRLGIGEALVYSALSRECGPELGDEWLLHETAGHARLHPCMTLVPGDRSLPAALDLMLAKGLRCARVFPRQGHFSVDPWCLAPAAEGLMKLGPSVLFVDYELTGWSDEGMDWEGVRRLCEAYPGLAIVIAGVRTPSLRLYNRLLAMCPNLYLEISHLHVPGELVRLCEAGYGGRVLFGSDSPTQFAGGVLSHARHAPLSDEDRAVILGGNLRRLLSAVPSDDGPVIAWPDSPPAIDIHVHHGRWQHSECGPGDADGMVVEMDRCGIAKAVLTSIYACYGGVMLGNAAVADACRRYPERLYGYITVDPKYPDELARELEQHGADASFRGLKFHCGCHGVELSHAGYQPAFEFADRRGWPILIHGGGTAESWAALCRRYPGARLIVAHMGGMLHEPGEGWNLLKTCREHENLFLDLGASTMGLGVLERMVEGAGADQVLYGSDYPLFDFGYERGRVDFSPLSRADKVKILWGNAARLLGLAGRR